MSDGTPPEAGASRAGAGETSLPERLGDRVVRGLAAVAGVALLSMLALIVGNVVLRQVADAFAGTVEVVGLLAAVVSGLALGAAQRQRSHVALDVVMARTPVRVQLVGGGFVTAVAAAAFGLLAHRMWLYGTNLREAGASTEVLRVPVWPVPLLVAVGLGGLCLALVLDLAQTGRQLRSREPQSLW